MAAVSRFRYAAYEACWGCRLSYARIVTPVEAPAMRRFLDRVAVGPWVYDWYAHVMFSERLLGAARGLQRAAPSNELDVEISAFASHWRHLKPLRDVLHHPASKALSFDSLWISDRIWYQEQGADPEWAFTVDELHDPVERLYSVIEATFPVGRH